ncbi:MAG: hypothetical protein ACRC16_18415, partial [Aeromonas salmonicida]
WIQSRLTARRPDPTQANLRDHGFAIKVPPSWRDLHASGRKLLRQGVPPGQVPERLGISGERWIEIQEACSVTVVALPHES